MAETQDDAYVFLVLNSKVLTNTQRANIPSSNTVRTSKWSSDKKKQFIFNSKLHHQSFDIGPRIFL